MMIWITGCDATGKTTLAHKLLAPGFEYVHYSKPNEDPWTYFSPAARQLEAGQNLIVDRWIEGCEIYNKVLDHGIPRSENPMWYEHLLQRVEQQAAILILCHEEPDIIRKRFIEKGEDFLPADKIEETQALFYEAVEKISQRNTIPCFLYLSSKDLFRPL